MRNKLIKKIFCLLVALSFIMIFATFTACGGNDDLPLNEKVEVTVDGGTGGGIYKEGDKCTVTATVPEGYRFVEWTVYGVSVSTSNPYTFDVDFDIEIKAVCEALPKTKYDVNVNGGTIGDSGQSEGTFDEGTSLDIYAAESQARVFVKWIIGDEESTQNPYKLTVTDDVEMTAVYDEYCMISVSGGTVNDERSDIVRQGTEVTVVANELTDGRLFDYWYTLGENYEETIVSEEASYTFELLESMKIYAKFSQLFTLTVTNGTLKDTDESVADIKDGRTAVIVPDAAPSADKAFIGWYIGDEKISIEKEYVVTVSNNMTIEAKYGELRTVKLPTPDSSGNSAYPTSGIIYREPNGAIAFDRLTNDKSKTMFAENVDYVRLDIFTSVDAESPVGAIRLTVDLNKDAAGGAAFVGSVETIDGKISAEIVRGDPGNYYIDGGNAGQFFGIMRAALGYDYVAGQNYYFAATVAGHEDPVITMQDDYAVKYENSDRSAIVTSAICEGPSSPVAKYDVRVIDGKIDGELTEISVGHGSSLTLTAEEPEGEEDWIFIGWKEVTYVEGEEVLGNTLSRKLSYVFTVTKSVTLKALFEKADETQYVKLTSPDNSANKLIYCEGGATYAMDRSGTSMFGENVDYVIFYIYDSTDAAVSEYVGRFKMWVDYTHDGAGGMAMVGYFSLLDDTQKIEVVRGNLGNYYTLNGNELLALMKLATGVNYVEGTTYYLAAQSIAHIDSAEYLDSDISVIGTNGFEF